VGVSSRWCARQEALSERMVGVRFDLVKKRETGLLRHRFVRCVGNITDDFEGPLLQPVEFVSKKQRHIAEDWVAI